MSRIEWDRSYSVKIEAMDEQHRMWFGYLNDVLEGITADDRGRVLDHVIPELVNYTEFHFGAEEKLMQDHNYPGLESHQVEHASFIKLIHEIEMEYNRGKQDQVLKLLDFMVGWLKNHILGTDRKYGDYLNELGVK